MSLATGPPLTTGQDRWTYISMDTRVSKEEEGPLRPSNWRSWWCGSNLHHAEGRLHGREFH